MFKKLLFVTALCVAVTACLEVPSDEELTEQEQDLDLLAPPAPASCDSTCMLSTSTCTTACTASTGQQTTCAANEGSCIQLLERKAREGRNPQTGETIQIPAKTSLK